MRLGHSPDSDDAFMFYALAEHKIPSEGFDFEHVLRDIQTLNEWAREGALEITAISVHAYAYVADKYAILTHGASMGDNYGPVVVTRAPGPAPSWRCGCSWETSTTTCSRSTRSWRPCRAARRRPAF